MLNGQPGYSRINRWIFSKQGQDEACGKTSDTFSKLVSKPGVPYLQWGIPQPHSEMQVCRFYSSGESHLGYFFQHSLCVPASFSDHGGDCSMLRFMSFYYTSFWRNIYYNTIISEAKSLISA